MNEKRFQKTRIVDKWGGIYDSETDKVLNVNDVEHKLNEQQATINELKEENDKLIQKNCIPCELVNLQTREIDKLKEENEQLKNELRKEKSLREYSDSMYGADLIVNIRFSNGEWKADVSVIDDE